MLLLSLKFFTKNTENKQPCHSQGWESEPTDPQLFSLKLLTVGSPRSFFQGMALTLR